MTPSLKKKCLEYYPPEYQQEVSHETTSFRPGEKRGDKGGNNEIEMAVDSYNNNNVINNENNNNNNNRGRTSSGLAQSVERLGAEREVAGSIPGATPILRVLKYLRNEGTTVALQTVGPSRGSDHHVEMAVPSPVEDVKIVSPVSTFVLNTLTLKKSEFFSLSERIYSFPRLARTWPPKLISLSSPSSLASFAWIR